MSIVRYYLDVTTVFVGTSTVSMNPFTVPNRANLRIWMWIWLIPTAKTVTVRNRGYL